MCSITNNHLTFLCTDIGIPPPTLGAGSPRPIQKCGIFLSFSLRCNSPETTPCSVAPGVSIAPNYNFTHGQISGGFFSTIDVPRGHSGGCMGVP